MVAVVFFGGNGEDGSPIAMSRLSSQEARMRGRGHDGDTKVKKRDRLLD